MEHVYCPRMLLVKDQELLGGDNKLLEQKVLDANASRRTVVPTSPRRRSRLVLCFGKLPIAGNCSVHWCGLKREREAMQTVAASIGDFQACVHFTRSASLGINLSP
jgi:hypothetical protein